MIFGILIPVSVVALLGVLVAAGVFILQRVRTGQDLGLSFRTITSGYFYLMAIAAFLVCMVGLSTGLKAGLSDAFGREFSYYMPPPPSAVRPMGDEVPPGRLPPPEEQWERQGRETERQYRNDLIQGMTLALVGGLLWVLHEIGRRRVLPKGDGTRLFLDRAHTTVLLGIFGIVGIVALPMGVYEALRYYLIPMDEGYSQPPGGSVATAIVFVPVWMYYLGAVLRRTRQEGESGC